MIRYLRIPVAVLGLMAFAVNALAQSPIRTCPYNDRKMPEKSNICRGGVVWICTDGEWIRQEGNRCTPPRN